MDPHETNNGRFLLRLGSKSSGWAVLLLLLLLSSYSAHADHQITGIAIASNGHVYVWFADGKVTDGVRENFEVNKHAYPYTLPAGKRGKERPPGRPSFAWEGCPSGSKVLSPSVGTASRQTG